MGSHPEERSARVRLKGGNSERDPLVEQAARQEGDRAGLLDRGAIFAPLAKARRLLLAVSGGPDSVALMLLASCWSRRGETGIEVATVDHGLREDSRQEAEQVGDWARRSVSPITSSPGKAKRQKPACRNTRARHAIALLKNARCGSAPTTSSPPITPTIKPKPFFCGSPAAADPRDWRAWPGLPRSMGSTLARPLLDVPKADLIAFCEAAGHPFLRDPSNENPAFARTRLRKLRTVLDAEGLDRASLLRLARRAARAEAALAETTASIRQGLSAERGEARVKIAGEALAGLPEEIFLRVLEAEVLAFSEGRDRLRLDRLECAAAEILAGLRNKRVFAATLGGARMSVTPGGDLEISRAPPRRTRSRSA